MSKRRNRISLIGVELEGGWHPDHPYRHEMGHDGSVSGFDIPLLPGEIASPPFDRLEAICLWIRERYPTAVNYTCGYHIHVSFKREFYYASLMRREFPPYVMEKLAQWGVANGIPADSRLFQRLGGGNRYAQMLYTPDIQVNYTGRSPNRYTAINYCWGLHKTLECRVLPMFDTPELACSALTFYVECVEDFLRKLRRDRIKTGVDEQDILMELEESSNFMVDLL